MNAEYYEKGRQLALKLAETNDEFYNRIVAKAGGPMPTTPAPKPVVKPPSKPVSPAGTWSAPTSQTGGSQSRELKREAVGL